MITTPNEDGRILYLVYKPNKKIYTVFQTVKLMDRSLNSDIAFFLYGKNVRTTSKHHICSQKDFLKYRMLGYTHYMTVPKEYQKWL